MGDRFKDRAALCSSGLVRRVFASLLAWVSSLASFAASAQFQGATDGVVVPASSVVLQDDAVVAEVNPALLGYLQGFSLAYVHAEVNRKGEWLGRGDALHLALPLWFDLSAALSLQSIRPGDAALRPFGIRADRGMAALSLAYGPSDSFAVGVTARGFSSPSGMLDGLAAIDMGMSLRPSPVLGISLVGRDLFASREGLGTAGLDLGSSLEFGIQLRPLGVDDLILDTTLASGVGGRVAGRAGLGVRIPWLGYAAATAEVERFADSDAVLRLVAELSLSYGGVTAAFGGMGGDGFSSNEFNWYAMARLEGFQRRGLPVGGAVLDLKLEGLGPRGMLSVLALLDRVRTDDRVAGVLLRPRGSLMGTAYAQELRMQIRALQAAGKPVACHLDGASGAEFYACTTADEVMLDPAGNVRFAGGAAHVLVFGGTLQKLGVRADFIRIGPYKSAPEQYTERTMSEPARQQLAGLMNDVQRRIHTDVAGDLGVSRSRVSELMDTGMFLALDAQAAGMIDGVADEVLLPQLGIGELGRRPLKRKVPDLRDRHMGTAARIGVVLVDGAIVDGENVDVPFLGTHMSGARTVVKALEGLASDPTVRAIVLRVDSPGGSVLACDQIWRAVMRARERKPVIASMGAVAASGGYYVAAAADEIWADPSTVTGSIGIFYGKVDISPLAEQLGVGIDIIQRGKRAGADSMWRSFTPDERAAFADRLRRYYRVFLERIKQGRGMDVARIDELGRGRIYSGDAAQRVGLVDHLGGFGAALRRARHLARLPPDASMVLLPKGPPGLLEMVLGLRSAGATASARVPAPLVSLAHTFSLLYLLDGQRAMALMPLDLRL
ncbi:MAG: signal peptide peptidase SppA [Myxococcales bacterium]|nr:signal peptide peptidase SppA [Myxococcales bacterium]MDD9969462.1 signal peptide peptidase SppA [Myxococcales bacterium]